MMKMRYNYVDISKGIVIILMVLGHSSIPKQLEFWIYSFHMPFFFFISGMLTKWNIDNNSFIRHKTRTLIKPFAIYSIINILLYPLYGNQSIWEFMVTILKNGWGGYPLWFIPVLYFSLIISKLTMLYNKYFIIIYCLVGMLLSKYDIRLSWTISTIPIAIVYLLLGKYSKNIMLKFVNFLNEHIYKTITIVLFFLIASFIISQFNRMDLASNMIIPFIPIFIASIIGILFIICISILIDRIPIISDTLILIGKNTYEILAFSTCIILILNQYIAAFVIVKYILMTFILFVLVLLKSYINSKQKIL